MNMISQELERQVLHPVMHRKILLRAAELVEQGWTRGTAARAADGLKVRSLSPAATSWGVVGAVRSSSSGTQKSRPTGRP
jgi:hypothetical protein